jgi:hypothetical protein
MGGACRKHGAMKDTLRIYLENVNGTDHLGDAGVYDRILLKQMEIGHEDMDWIYPARDGV